MEQTKQPFLTFSQKIFVIVAVLSVTFLYSHYQKGIYDQFVNKAPDLILKEMPEFEAINIDNKELLSKESFMDKYNGVLVHFWGTWCAPCEAELPSFMKFAKSLEEKDIAVLVLAVNDEEKAVKKFLTRFKKSRPANIIYGLDKEGLSLPLFGSVKVPETYLFSKSLRHLEKFIGPQDWEHRTYKDRVLRFLNLSGKLDYKKVETH